MNGRCKLCDGSGRVPLPRGMSTGFYAFMSPGCDRRDDGALLMLCECRAPKEPGRILGRNPRDTLDDGRGA